MHRRQYLTMGVTTTVVALAGCAGDGDGSGGESASGDENDSGTGDTGEETNGEANGDDSGGDGTDSESSGDDIVSGEVVTDTVEELEIVSHTTQKITAQGLFQVEMTLRNAGEKNTRITPGAYNIQVTLFDESGTELATQPFNNIESRQLPAGESRWVRASANLDDLSAVARYEISLACQDSGLGAYC